MSIVNPSLAAFLLDNPPRCISVAYDRTVTARGEQPVDIKSFKTFDTTIAKGDFVVVPTDTRWGFTVGRVEAVDTLVNYASHEQMRWVAGRVDKAGYDDILKQEEGLFAKVGQATEAKAKRELLGELQALDAGITGMTLLSAPPLRTGGGEPEHRGGAQQFEGNDTPGH